MAISTFIFLCCLLGISSFVDSFNICLRGINQVHHRWHTILLSTSSIERTSVVAIETTEIIAKRKSTKKKNLSAKERTGYEYVENGVEFDVPVISTPKWFRVLVRKNSESTLCESFSDHASTSHDGIFRGKVVDAFYPKSALLKFRGKRQTGQGLSVTHKPMIPGLLFVKTIMNADIADDLEAVNGVRGFAKNLDGLVVPLGDQETAELEALRKQELPVLDAETQRLRIGEYVSIVGGRHEGKYGIIEGASNGKIEVRLRSEYRDSQDAIDVQHLRFLAHPPEVNYKDMTAKQAVEALLVKEPNGETLRFLRKEGLLNQILHPERAAGYRERRPPQRAKDGALSASFGSEGAYKYASAVERQGREGGRSQRSIASAKTTNHNDDSNQAMENGGTSAPLSSSSSSSSSTPPPPPRVYNTRGAGVANPLAVETKTSENDVARVTSPSSAEVSTEMTGEDPLLVLMMEEDSDTTPAVGRTRSPFSTGPPSTSSSSQERRRIPTEEDATVAAAGDGSLELSQFATFEDYITAVVNSQRR